MADVRIELSSPGMDALLKSGAVGSHLEGLMRARAGSGVRVTRQVGRSRQNIRGEYSGGRNDLDREAKTGALRRLLG